MANVINAGPMQLYHITETETITMPPTQGGVTMSFDFTTLDTLADITGEVARDMYYTGMTCTITANYTEMTLEEVLLLFPKVEGNAVSIPIGCNARDDVIGLLMRPVICGEVEEEDDTVAIYAPVVLAKPAFNVEFSLANQRIWTVEYQVLPYDPRNHDFQMLYFGQTTT